MNFFECSQSFLSSKNKANDPIRQITTIIINATTTMKFTFGNLVGLLGLASAQNLRPATFMHDAATTSMINTSVIFQGIKAEDATNEDKDMITESVAAAFDQVYGEPDNESGMLGFCGPICRRKRREEAAKVQPDAGCGGWVSLIHVC